MENNDNRTGRLMNISDLIPDKYKDKTEKKVAPSDGQARRNVIGGPDCP